MYSERANAPAKVIINNYLSACGGGLVAVFLKPRILHQRSFVHRFDIATLCNGIIVGLVAVTSSCDRIEPWAALCIGGIGACCYTLGCVLIEKFGIDDPVEASPLHFGGGLWGTLAVGIFDNEFGLLYPDAPNRWKYFGVQCLGALAIIAWVSLCSLTFFGLLNHFNLFRIPKEIEIMGLDIAEMGGVDDELYSKMNLLFGKKVGDDRLDSPVSHFTTLRNNSKHKGQINERSMS